MSDCYSTFMSRVVLGEGVAWNIAIKECSNEFTNVSSNCRILVAAIRNITKTHVSDSRILKGQFSVGLGLKRVFFLEDTIVDHPLLCHLLLSALVIFCFRRISQFDNGTRERRVGA
jgi:hypothetical protein